MADQNLEKLERQYEQAKARLQSARARKATLPVGHDDVAARLQVRQIRHDLRSKSGIGASA